MILEWHGTRRPPCQRCRSAPNLSPEDLRRFAKLESDARVARRLLALANALDGMDRATAAKLGGMDALADDWGDGRPCRLDDGQQAVLKAIVLRGPDREKDGISAWRVRDLCRIVEDRFGVRYAQSGLTRLLHALDLSWQTPRPRHPKADPAAQEAFKRKFWRVQEQIAAEHAEKGMDRFEIWFQDEARVGQKGRVTRRWYQRGERPRMRKDQG